MQPSKRFLGALLAVSVLPIAAWAEHPRTITEIVAASGGEFDGKRNDFDILLNAVQAAELVDALADPNANLTVFAPTDRAFIRLAREFGYVGDDEAEAFNAIVAVLTSLAPNDPIGLLRNILLYHVSPDAKSLQEIQSEPIVVTAFDGNTVVSVRQRLLDNEPDVANPRFIRGATDIEASNGIVHAINRVLIPLDVDNVDSEALPTIAGAVAASGGVFDHDQHDFDILLNAVQAAGLVDALNNPADSLTVYAPTDAAFIRTARALGFHGHDEAGAFQFIVVALTSLSDDDDPIPLLRSILLYHVAPGALTLKNTLESESVSTLLADATIHPQVDNRALGDNEPGLRDPRLISRKSNIRVANGFIQPISRVLIPVELSTL